MRRLSLAGLPGRPRYRKIRNTQTASDLVIRDFARTEPNRLWLTDITAHRIEDRQDELGLGTGGMQSADRFELCGTSGECARSLQGALRAARTCRLAVADSAEMSVVAAW